MSTGQEIGNLDTRGSLYHEHETIPERDSREDYMGPLTDKTAIVVGASRGLGRGVTEAFLDAGARVVALARDTRSLTDLSHRNPLLKPESADASDPTLVGNLLDRYRPDIVALIAGAAPPVLPLQDQTWETFSINWNTDVRMTFNWVRAALLLPLRPGSRIIVMSSAAALRGSPLSGGYAGAKATQRFIADYAAQESERSRLGITVTSVLPQITNATDLGRPFVAAYAARSGLSDEEYQARIGEPVTPQTAGAAFVQLAANSLDTEARAYLLTAGGLQPLPS
jgi:NAD(P)-dependent dehydrogenase (short-subunit alcohol dehydrogenase family)